MAQDPDALWTSASQRTVEEAVGLVPPSSLPSDLIEAEVQIVPRPLPDFRSVHAAERMAAEELRAEIKEGLPTTVHEELGPYAGAFVDADAELEEVKQRAERTARRIKRTAHRQVKERVVSRQWSCTHCCMLVAVPPLSYFDCTTVIGRLLTVAASPSHRRPGRSRSVPRSAKRPSEPSAASTRPGRG